MKESLESVETLDMFFLREGYLSGRFTPREVAMEVLRRIGTRSSSSDWIHLVPESEVMERADSLASLDRNLPFYGIPFSVKDNIHVEGLPITAGCSAFASVSHQTSPVVRHILNMGGLLIGKNTMDEFATGVVGVRSDPHPVNPFNADYIPGGSSSGSGVVVSKGCVTFSLGSDTGGSGRVPAALGNVVGFKPTPHSLSSEGMVYANRSIDCMPIFVLTVREADYIYRELRNVGGEREAPQAEGAKLFNGLRLAIPDKPGLKFFGDTVAQASFDRVLSILQEHGCQIQEVDFRPFAEAGAMLFDGAFISERFDSVGVFIENHPAEVNDVVRTAVSNGAAVTPHEIWRDLARLNQLKEIVRQSMEPFDGLLTPTAGTIYRIAEVKADPHNLNRNMAYYTNFGNLLDLSVVSVPGTIRSDGLPFGISFTGLQHSDFAMLAMATRWEQISGVAPGARKV